MNLTERDTQSEEVKQRWKILAKVEKKISHTLYPIVCVERERTTKQMKNKWIWTQK